MYWQKPLFKKIFWTRLKSAFYPFNTERFSYVSGFQQHSSCILPRSRVKAPQAWEMAIICRVQPVGCISSCHCRLCCYAHISSQSRIYGLQVCGDTGTSSLFPYGESNKGKTSVRMKQGENKHQARHWHTDFYFSHLDSVEIHDTVVLRS